MITKRDLVIAVLCTFCLTFTLFTILPTRSNYSTSEMGEYDPWLDSNDDGKINILECIVLSGAFGTNGTPINKTALLLELISRVDSLNASFLNLEAYLETRITSLETSLTTQQSKIDSLNETIQLLETRIIDLEYNFSLLNPYVVSYNSTYNATGAGTTETLSWVDMPSTSVDISLNTTCHLLIMFSTEARTVYAQDSIVVRVLIENATYSDTAFPEFLCLTPTVSEELGWPSNHRHILGYSSYSYNFNKPLLPPGTYTIKVQWRLQNTAPPIGTGYVYYRTLNVIALP